MQERLVTAYNALEVVDKDVWEEISSINETCYNIMCLSYITVTNIHMRESLCNRVRNLVAKDNFYGQKIKELIEMKGKFLYLKLDGKKPKVKIQEKYGGDLTARPWWLTVSPIVNKGDRSFRPRY